MNPDMPFNFFLPTIKQLRMALASLSVFSVKTLYIMYIISLFFCELENFHSISKKYFFFSSLFRRREQYVFSHSVFTQQCQSTHCIKYVIQHKTSLFNTNVRPNWWHSFNLRNYPKLSGNANVFERRAQCIPPRFIDRYASVLKLVQFIKTATSYRFE